MVRLAQEAGTEATCRQLAAAVRGCIALSGRVPSPRHHGPLGPVAPTAPTASDHSSLVGEVMLTIRLLTYWNSKRITAQMDRRHAYRVGHAYIDRLFRAQGSTRGRVPPRPSPRYERTRPNELWHIDITGPFSWASPVAAI